MWHERLRSDIFVAVVISLVCDQRAEWRTPKVTRYRPATIGAGAVALHLTTKDTKSTKDPENDAVEAIFPTCRSTSWAQLTTRLEIFGSSTFALFVSFVVVLISLVCHQRAE